MRWRKADGMPTVPDIPGPYRLFFYSFDCHEPPHVHVERERNKAKFWLDPVRYKIAVDTRVMKSIESKG